MTANPSADFLFAGVGRSAKFENVGDVVTGRIATTPQLRQQTDFKSGQPVFWNDGSPKNQLVVTLQTDARDDEHDDGLRNVYIKGKSLSDATRDALRTAGTKSLELGGTLTVTHTGHGPAARAGEPKPKLYTVAYKPPSAAGFVDEPDEDDPPF